MGILRLVAAALLAAAACYEPHLPDCTVRCASSDDCAPGQVCGAQGYCAASGLACPSSGAPADAAPADTRKPDDPPEVQLHVLVGDGGKVRIDGTGTCDSSGAQQGDCLFTVMRGAALRLRAVPQGGYSFDRWTSAACEGEPASCDLTLIMPLTEVQATFVPDQAVATSAE
jgi:hypothetical protein